MFPTTRKLQVCPSKQLLQKYVQRSLRSIEEEGAINQEVQETLLTRPIVHLADDVVIGVKAHAPQPPVPEAIGTMDDVLEVDNTQYTAQLLKDNCNLRD